MKTVLWLAVVGMAGMLVGNDTARAQDKKEKGQGKAMAPYVHAVIFYLKKEAPKDAVEGMIADSHKLLGKIPSVKGLWVGRPAEKSTPKFAVTDYQVGLLVLFDNYQGLHEYLEHKLHDEFLEKHAKHWDRVPVYDFVNQPK